MSNIQLNFQDIDLRDLYGVHNSNIELLKSAFPELKIITRGNRLQIEGEKKEAQKAKNKVELMVKVLKNEQKLPAETVKSLIGGHNPLMPENGKSKKSDFVIVHGRRGALIKAKTPNQLRMVENIVTNDIMFAVGPAGTGKTYTAVALAVKALKNKEVKKIILTRPAVEAGESLGFLPGDLKEKIDPYLRPLYDALDDMIDGDKLKVLMENRIIEIAPLAYMRGRTLDDAFIILDESQNCTLGQLKMFLTRLGPKAKCIVTGDFSQVDLPRHQKSGLKDAMRFLRGIDGIALIELEDKDVVRHRLVKSIINAFDKGENRDFSFKNRSEEE